MSKEMDGLRWSRVLLQWVKDSRLVACECTSIEQCNVQEFFTAFRTRMEPTLAVRETEVVDFLRVHFPHYELYLTESGQIAAPDHYYIFSLLLFFSCVRHPEPFFQRICSGFDKPQQYAVTAFLKSMLEGSHLRKEIDRMMIRKAIEDSMPKTMMPPASPVPTAPAGGQNPENGQSTLSFPSATRITVSSSSGGDVTDSPLRLGTRPLRLSPPTPKTLILDERTRQLKELKAQLEAERYEKGYLEVQLKQLQDKNEKFLEDKRKNLKEIRELRAELQSCNRENESPNKRRVEDNKVARLERQIAEKEEALDKLRIELETVGENNKNATEMINYRNNQILVLKDKILELEGSIVSLSECLEKRDEMIKYLRENCEDLQNFIDENRLQQAQNGSEPTRSGGDILNTSCDMLELSSTGTTGSIISPENMACAVVDVQLKEKEAENTLLKRSLEMIEQEKVRVSSLVGQFFRLYGDAVGKLPVEGGSTEGSSFVEKMQCFKACYETLFEEHGKFREGNIVLEERNEALEEDVRQLRGELVAVTEVLKKLESHSAEIEKELDAVRKTAGEYQRQNAAKEELLVKQKRDYLKLIAEKDTISQEHLTLKVEYNSLKGDYDTITQKIDYLMVSLDEDYEGSDFSSWFDKMDDLRVRLATLKDEKDRLETMNMKLLMEKVALEKEISNGELSRKKLEDMNSEANGKISTLEDQLKQVQETLGERDANIESLKKQMADLEETSQSLSAELEEAQSALSGVLGKLKLSEESLQVTQDQLARTEQELVQANETNGSVQKELQSTIQTLQESLQRNSEQDEQLLQQIVSLEDDLRSKSEQLDQVNAKIADLSTFQAQTIDEKNQLEQFKNDLEQRLLDTQTESSAHINTLEAQLRALQQTLEQAEQRDRSQQDQLEEARIQQQLVTSCNDALLAGMNVLQDKIASLDRRYKSKNVGLTAKLDQIADLLKKLSAVQYKLRLEKSSLEDTVGELRRELEVAKKRSESLEVSESSLKEVVEQLRSEKVAFEEELSDVTDRLKLESKVVEQLREDLETLGVDKSTREASLKEQLDSTIKLTEHLKEEISAKEEVRSRLESQLEEKNEQLRNLSNERDELEIKCTKLEVDLKETVTNLESQKQLSVKTSQANIEVEQQLETVRSNLTQVEAERTRVEQELTETREELNAQSTTVSRLCSDKEQLEQKIQALAEALNASRQSSSAFQESFEREQEKSEELTCQLANLNAQLVAIAQDVTRLTDEQEELLTTHEALKSHRDKLIEQVEELTESVTVLEEDRDTLREEKCRLEAECERVDAEREALGEQCAKLLGEVARKNESVKKLEEDVKGLEGKLALAIEERTVVDEKVRQLEETNRTLESTLSEKGAVEGRVVELAKSVEQLQAEKSALDADKFALKKEIETTRSTMEDLKNELSTMETAKKQLEEDIETMRTTNGSLTDTLEQVTEQLQGTSKKVETLQANVEELSKVIDAKDTELLEKNAAVEEIRKNLLAVEESMQAKVNELTTVSEHLLVKTKELETVQSTKEEEILQQTASITIVQKECQETRDQLQAVLEEKTKLQIKIEALSAELDGRVKEIAKAENAIKSKDQEIQSIVEALTTSEAASAELTRQLQSVTTDKQTLETQLEALQNELDSKQQDLEQFFSKLTDTDETKQELAKQLQELTTARNNLQEQVHQLSNQLTEQKNLNLTQTGTIAAKDHEIAQLTAGLEQIKTFQQQLEEKVTDFEQVVSEKDEVETQLVKAQNDLELVSEEKTKLEAELDKLSEEKADVDRRLIQQLQDYDTLNEGFLHERDQKETMVRQMKTLFDEKQAVKSQLTAKEKQLDKLKREMDELFGKNKQMDTLVHELMSLKVEKTELEAKKEELFETIEHKEIQEKALQDSMEHLRESLKMKQQEIEALNSDMSNLKESLHNMKIENSKLKSAQELQQTKMLNLEMKNSEQSKKIEHLEASLSKTEISHLEDNSKATSLLKELEQYKLYEIRLVQLEELHRKEKEINAQCVRDNDILSAKLKRNRKQTEEKEQQWLQEKQKLLEKMNDSSKTAEEKVKETRIEYEGKLEKMKDKMKSLYNDEMEKIRTKHEKDFLQLRAELQQETKKFEKLELQTTKLQQQLSNVNQKNLDLMKENEHIKSVLRIEEKRKERSSMHQLPDHARICSNFKMEDEEGEIFNNTYLTDLKAGRMSPPFAGRESVRYSELQKRNSMVPPHLKSSYMPQYTDGDLTDDDRDVASVNLDDSSTSLISRRKQGGTTSYKRPGPPTPSKKAGRLSFGGSLPTNDFQYKEIAKDNNASSNSGMASLASRLSFGGGRKSNVDSTTVLPGGAGAASGSTLADLNARRKTPGKFKQMFSSSNLLNTLHKDESTVASKPAIPHPAIHKITCQDDTDSGSSGVEDRRLARRLRAKRRESIGLRTSSRAHKVPHVRKLIARFDKNRRLSSVDSDSAGSSPKMMDGDPYDGFGQYEYGTPDQRVQRIDINAMAVFGDRKELPLPKVIVFSGEGRDDDGLEEGEIERQQFLYDHHDLNNNLDNSDFVQQLSIKRRDKQRRKSRDQRRQSFNRLRDIDGEVIAIADSIVDLDEAMLLDSSQFQFESLLQDITLDRPSEILPRSGRRRIAIDTDQLDHAVVTSSTGMPTIAGIPLLERFSEIFRIATLQQSKVAAKTRNSGVTISSAVSSETNQPVDWSYYMLVLFAGLSFSSLLLSIYMHYVDYRVSKE